MAKHPFLQDHSFSLTLTFLLGPVRLWRHDKEHKVPDGIVPKVIEARKLPTPQQQGGDNRGSQH